MTGGGGAAVRQVGGPPVIAWCGPEAAQTVHMLTRAAFAGQELLSPPSSATAETIEVVEADLAAGRGVLAAVGGAPVAAARVLLFEDHLQVRRVAVHPDFRRAGLATAIMRWLQERATDMGYDYVALGARKAISANRALYERLGYYEVADHGFWVEMRLDLQRHGQRSEPTVPGARI